ncbi:MAG: MFS transporter [Thermomicrobiales bacterium]
MQRTNASATRDRAPSSPDVSPEAPVTRSRLPNGLRSLAHRDYRIFFGTQLFSLTGTWMQTLAQSWLVLSLTNSPAALGLVGVFQFGPTLLLGLPAGVFIDRVPKRYLLIVTQIFFAIITALLALQLERGQLQLWQIYAAALGLGVVSAFDMPARQAFVVDLVGRDDLMNGIALNSALFNTSRIVGPALAGLLLSHFGPGICFVLNSVSYIPVIIGLLMMRALGLPRGDLGNASPVERLREGLRYVRTSRAVLLPIILAGLMAVFGMNFNVWAPLLARDAFDIGAGGFGLLMSSLGVGSLTGALILAFTGRRPSPRMLVTTALAFGVLELALALAAGMGAPPLLAMALMVGVGFTMTSTMTQANSTVQTNTPDAMRGRVMSIYLTVFAGGTPIGDALAGAFSDLWGVAIAIAIGGAVVAAVALLIARQLPRAEEALLPES